MYEESGISLYAPEGKAHIALFLVASQASFETMMSITAGLLASGYRVTLFYQHSQHQILRNLLSRIPCADHTQARSLLTFRAFDQHPFRCNDAFACEIQNAAGLVKELHSGLQSNPFDLVVTDGIFVAGMVVAELLHLPTIALLEGTNHLRRIFGPILSNQPWYTWLIRVIYDRLQILDQMKEFVELNRLRTQFGLERLRTLSDFWTRENQLLMTLQNVSIPNVLRIPSPLLPPCVPCLPNEFSNITTLGSPIASTDTPALVLAVTFSNSSQGRISSRTLMQALSLARASLQEIAQTSAMEPEDNAGRAKRWSGPSSFVVVRWDESFEALQPAFVTMENPEYVWDSLVRFKPVVGIVTSCNGGVYDVMQNMGPPILCLEHHPQSPRELGKAILKFISAENDFATSSLEPNDGLVCFVSLIDELMNREAHVTMELLNERIQSLQEIFIPELDSYHSFENSAITCLTLAIEYLAWIIMISVLLYVHLKPIVHKFYPFSKRHARRSHHLRDMQDKPITLTLIAEEWVDRLPELDYVFDIWKTWWWQELANFQTPKPTENNSSHTTKNKRRTNHHKKKH
jgi:hypothetical protein